MTCFNRHLRNPTFADTLDLAQKELTKEQNTRLQEIDQLEINLNETIIGNIGLFTKELQDVKMNNGDFIQQLRGESKFR